MVQDGVGMGRSERGGYRMGYEQKKWGGEVQDEVQGFGRQETNSFPTNLCTQ